MDLPLVQAAFELRQIFKDVAGVCWGGETPEEEEECGYDTLVYAPMAVPGAPPLQRLTQNRFARSIGGTGNTGFDDDLYLFPLPISFQMNITLPDADTFHAFNFEYCNQVNLASHLLALRCIR